MFYIEPTSGLCNRLRVIRSAYYLAQQSGQELTVVWNYSRIMNIPMEQLFTIPKDIKIISFDYNSSSKLVRLFKKIKYKAYYFFMEHRKDCLFIGTNDAFEIKKAKEEYKIPEYLKSNKNVYIKTCSEFTNSGAYDMFSPSQQVLNRLSEVQKKCNVDKNTIGIHIRRTDNEESILHSPTCLFEQRMAEELKSNPDTKFYLATDSSEEETKLKEEFGDCIITFEDKDSSRYTETGQIDAYVELLMLSKCKEIWGSYFSSFSSVASKIGQIKLEILKN